MVIWTERRSFDLRRVPAAERKARPVVRRSVVELVAGLNVELCSKWLRSCVSGARASAFETSQG